MQAILSVSSIKKVVFLLSLAVCSSAGGQHIQAVKSTEVSLFEGKSFLFKDGVRLLPGFQFTATASEYFFCKFDNIVNQPPSLSENFIRSEVVLVPGAISEDIVARLPIGEKVKEYAYFDGLGRRIQTIFEQGSSIGNDIIKPIEYDDLGRIPREYLAFTRQQKAGGFRDSGTQELLDFYSASHKEIPTDSRPFKENFFDSSPENKILEVLGPGSGWLDGQLRHSTKALTKTNALGEVPKWKRYSCNFPFENCSLPEQEGSYPPGSLIVRESTNENGKVTRSI